MRRIVAWPLGLLLAIALFFTAVQVRAQEDFLEPEKAFVFSARMVEPRSLQLEFKVAPGYYLYRERLGFTPNPAQAVALGTPVLPDGEVKYDPTFEKNMEVYHRALQIQVPLPQAGEAFTLDVAYQGCADAGLCYPPMSHQLSMAPVRDGWTIVAHGADHGALAPVTSGQVDGAERAGVERGLKATISGFFKSSVNPTSPPTAAGVAGSASSQSAAAGGTGNSLPQPAAVNGTDANTAGREGLSASEGDVAGQGAVSEDNVGRGMSGLFSAGDLGLADAIGGLGVLQIALVFFGLGVLLALTPCVLPMVPILSALVVRDAAGAKTSRMRGLALAASYVAGMSVVYTALGVAAGLSGAGLAATLQNPWTLAVFALILAVLALATFGAFTLQIPPALQSRLSAAAARTPRGRMGGAALMGAISALIVGPCVAAPLAGALLYISQTGDVVLGALALFALAWGMGLPLLVVGASSTAWLPAAGPWMAGVNRLFGMLLLGTAWFILMPVLPISIQMAGWGFLLVVGGLMLLFAGGGLAPGVAPGTLRLFGRGLGVVLLLAGAAQVLGAMSGGRDLLSPLGHLSGVRTVSIAAGGSASNAVGPGYASSGGGTGAAGATGPAVGSGVPGAVGPAVGSGAPGAVGVAGAAEAIVGRVTKPVFQRVRTLAELEAAVAGSTRPVMLDFYADWCVSCHEMERFTFTDPRVARRMAGMTLLQADVTANNADDRALLKKFRLFGPPGIIFFDERGEPRTHPRVIGFQNAQRFAQSLDEALVAPR